MSSGLDRNHYRRSGPSPSYHGNPAVRSGMVQARSVPKPVQTCSLKAENGGQDVSFPLVHRGRVGHQFSSATWGAATCPESEEKGPAEPVAEPVSVEVPWAMHPRSDAPQHSPIAQHTEPCKPTRWSSVHVDREEASVTEQSHGYERQNYYEGGTRSSSGSQHRGQHDSSNEESFVHDNSRYDRRYYREEHRWKGNVGLHRGGQNDHRSRYHHHQHDALSHAHINQYVPEQSRRNHREHYVSRNSYHSERNEGDSQSRPGDSPSLNENSNNYHHPPAQSEEAIILEAIRARDAAEERERMHKAQEERAHVQSRGMHMMRLLPSSLQTSGEPSGAPLHLHSPENKVDENLEQKKDSDSNVVVLQQKGLEPRESEPSHEVRLSVSPSSRSDAKPGGNFSNFIGSPAKVGGHETTLHRDAVFNSNNQERNYDRVSLALEQQQKVLRQVEVARARSSKKKTVERNDYGTKTTPRPPWRRASDDGAQKREPRQQRSGTRRPRTKGLLFRRLPDGSVERVDTCQTKEPTSNPNFIVSQKPDTQQHTKQDSGKGKNPTQSRHSMASVWNSGPPAGIIPKSSGLTPLSDRQVPVHSGTNQRTEAMEVGSNHLGLGRSFTSALVEKGKEEIEQATTARAMRTTAPPLIDSWSPFEARSPNSQWILEHQGDLSNAAEHQEIEVPEAAHPHAEKQTVKNPRRPRGPRKFPPKSSKKKNSQSLAGREGYSKNHEVGARCSPTLDSGKSKSTKPRKASLTHQDKPGTTHEQRKTAAQPNEAKSKTGRNKNPGRPERKPRRPRKQQVVASDAQVA